MSQRQQMIQTYASGFATGDLEQILSCVSDDLVWKFNGQQAGEGKTAFKAQMTRDLASGTAQVTSSASWSKATSSLRSTAAASYRTGKVRSRPSSLLRRTRSPAPRSAACRPTSRWADCTARPRGSTVATAVTAGRSFSGTRSNAGHLLERGTTRTVVRRSVASRGPNAAPRTAVRRSHRAPSRVRRGVGRLGRSLRSRTAGAARAR